MNTIGAYLEIHSFKLVHVKGIVDTVLYLVAVLPSVTSVKNEIDLDGPGIGADGSSMVEVVGSVMLFNSLA